MAVEFKTSPLFLKTVEEMGISNPAILDRFEEFKKFKSQTPLASFGSSDKPLSGQWHFGQAVPGIKHAHLSRDISVWYTTSGKDPIVIKLYGIFTHKDTGTGTPPNLKKQKSMAKVFKNIKDSG